MNRFASTALAATLALVTGAVSAQSYGGQGYGGYASPNQSGSPSSNNSSGRTEYARVVRVDPVLDRGYATGNNGYASSSNNDPRCYDNQYSTGGDVYEERSYRGYGSDNSSGRYGDTYGDRYGERDRGYGGYGGGVGRTTATVLGGVVGAVLGSKMGGGTGRYATSALGSMMGGMAGQAVYDQTVRSRTPPRQATIRVCDPVPVDDRQARDYGRDGSSNVQQYDVTYEYAGRQYTTRTNYNPGERIRVRVDVRPE